MNSYRGILTGRSLLGRGMVLAFLAFTFIQLTLPRVRAAANIVIWDTIVPLPDTADGSDRSVWKAVPIDLLTLEADPPKASSDPGYYGREYAFKGDMVVENHSLAAVFRATQGRVVFHSKSDAGSNDVRAVGAGGLGRKILELVPLQSTTSPARLSHFGILRHGGDEVAVEVSFAVAGAGDVSATFIFDKTGIAEIKPGATLRGVRLMGALDHAIVPGFITDDLIFGATEATGPDSLNLPAENLLVGLLKGGNDEWVLTWPKGRQQIRLAMGKAEDGKRPIESVDFENDGQSLYVATLGAPGIWHREELKPSYLEKDAAIGWKRPFPARWKTQLYEEGVRTTFTFREAKGQIWRGVPGSYSYPVWFDGDNAQYHLGKKVPPKGESLIYFLEGQDTPRSVTTPFEILQATLGRSVSDPILDLGGRTLSTHHRRGSDGVRRACTCGCTEVIQAFFEAGEEAGKIKEIQAALDDMRFFVEHHVARIDEYRRFADDLVKFLHAQGKGAPGTQAYLDSLESIVLQIPQEYGVQKENMGSPEYADQLTRQTLALAGKKDPGNLKAYMDLLKAWRAMGGAQDYVLARCHMITRKLCQEAGYGSVNQPGTVALAMDIRSRCRQILRNPDGYEIWADY